MKASIAKHFWHLWVFWFYLFACAAIPFYLSRDSADGLTDFSIYAGFVAFVVLCLPTLVIYPRYFSIESKAEVAPYKDGVRVRYQSRSSVYQFSEIERVEFNLSIPQYFNGIMFQVTDSLYYAVLYMKSGDRLVITTLSDIGLFESMAHFKERVSISRSWSIFCLPPRHVVQGCVL